MQHTAHVEQRVIRVFISSTFRDMHAERDYLVKKIFPELRARCRARQVEFIDVDLRWGITQKQAERGEVLHACLAEIDNCHYFISLLGQRYGWVPSRIDEQLIKEHKWLEAQRGKSVTEIEILYGALNRQRKTNHVFFYFRQRSFIGSFYSKKSRSDHKKLVNLKRRIRESGRPVGNYSNLEILGKRILDDVWRAIDKQYPAISAQADLERERAEHTASAENRARTYIPRPGYYDRLDAYVMSDRPPLILLGESGVGKTSLLANWALEFQKKNKNYLCIVHFIGNTPHSADYEVILKRIIGEIKQHYGLTNHVPESLKDLRESFSDWLNEAARRGQAILVLDGLNQLEERDDALTLGWIPDRFPSNIRVIGSTLPGSTLNAVMKRKWLTFDVKGLKPSERRAVIRRYLKQFGKELEEEFIDSISKAPQSRNPLFVRALLEELRIFGKFQKLDERIRNYLKAPDTLTLYQKILDRMEKDYEGNRKDLVRDALSLIWASRKGLYENELLELLRERDNPLPRAVWSPFYLAIQESLVSRSGLLGFFHDYLRQAVQKRYLSSPEEEFDAHRRLAEYYEAMFSDSGARENFRSLSLEAANEAFKVAKNSKNIELSAEGHFLLAGSLISAAVGVSTENALLFKKAWEMAKEGCEIARLTNTRDGQLSLACGLILRARTESGYNPEYGDISLIEEAIGIYKELKELQGKPFSRYGVAGGYCDALYEKAVIGLRLRKWDVVESSLKEAQEKISHLRNYERIKKAHIKQVWGEYYAQRGLWEKARKSLERAREMYKEEDYHGGVCAAKGWLGISLCNLGQPKKGLGLVREALEFERDNLGSQEGVAKWLHELGKYFWTTDEKKRALHAFWLCEELREAQNHAELPKTKRRLEVARREMEKNYQKLKDTFDPRKTQFGQYAFLWGLGPFRRHKDNPILAPRGDGWESKAVFNPAAWTDGKKVHLLYRAQGIQEGSKVVPISCIGLAESKDGIHFEREARPVMEPTRSYERGGGCEDPRLVRIDDVFYMTYTAYDGKTARLAMAVSNDLHHWEKKGPIFTDDQLNQLEGSQAPKGWCKSGAIYRERIGGYYWMFFGDKHIWAATSRDLKRWEVVKTPILSPRDGNFDSYLVEPGPPPIFVADPGPPAIECIWLGYNAARLDEKGKPVYAFGQASLDPYNPSRVLRRCSRPLLEPTIQDEIVGQVPNVVFGEGLVKLRGEYFLYYGMADSRVGVAIANDISPKNDQ